MYLDLMLSHSLPENLSCARFGGRAWKCGPSALFACTLDDDWKQKRKSSMKPTARDATSMKYKRHTTSLYHRNIRLFHSQYHRRLHLASTIFSGAYTPTACPSHSFCPSSSLCSRSLFQLWWCVVYRSFTNRPICQTVQMLLKGGKKYKKKEFALFIIGSSCTPKDVIYFGMSWYLFLPFEFDGIFHRFLSVFLSRFVLFFVELFSLIRVVLCYLLSIWHLFLCLFSEFIVVVVVLFAL